MEKKREIPRSAEFFGIDGKPVNGEKAFNDIAEALLKLRGAFIRNGFAPPLSLEMGSHDDGYKLRHILPLDMVIASAAEDARDANKTAVAFNIVGIELRYPAHFRRLQSGRIETL